jgi:hypothetical protein
LPVAERSESDNEVGSQRLDSQRCSLMPKYMKLLPRRDIVLLKLLKLSNECGQSQQSFAMLGKGV